MILIIETSRSFGTICENVGHIDNIHYVHPSNIIGPCFKSGFYGRPQSQYLLCRSNIDIVGCLKILCVLYLHKIKERIETFN